MSGLNESLLKKEATLTVDVDPAIAAITADREKIAHVVATCLGTPSSSHRPDAWLRATHARDERYPSLLIGRRLGRALPPNT